MKTFITKTDIKNFRQCPLRFYKEFMNPELTPEKDPYSMLLVERGEEAGEIARREFPRGLMIYKKGMSIKETCEATALNKQEVLFEAGFCTDDNLHVRVDILKPKAFIEVKSGSKLDDDYLEDAAIQWVVMKKSGMDVEKAFVWYINKKCELPDLTNFFIKEDVTEKIQPFISSIEESIDAIQSLLKSKKEPKMDIGPHCSSPYDCPFKSECYKSKNISEISVFDIPRIGKRAWDYYKQGVTELKDLDPTPFTSLQRRMIDAHVSGNKFLNLNALIETFEQWKFPFYFLDFEAMEYPFPGLLNTTPGQMVPFQASIHMWKSPTSSIEKVADFFHEDNSDPRMSLSNFLATNIPLKGTVIAYNAPFEKGKIKDLIKFASKEDALVLEQMLSRFEDPLPLIRDSYYDPAFLGSYSIKTVAPAMLGENSSYKHLLIQDGTACVVAYRNFLKSKDVQEKKALKEGMISYCNQDTLVLAQILKFLYNLAYGP